MGLDISEGALKVAKGNAQKLDVEIEFEKADIFELAGLGHKFDIIVSNPPYVRESEKVKMRPNVLEYEPSKALFVPNDNALLYYRAIADFARKNLSKSGKLFLEINQYLAIETRQLLEAHNFMDIEVRKDIYGNKRMIRAGFSKRENNQLL
jgi:release factor glutamine methyltransferase